MHSTVPLLETQDVNVFSFPQYLSKNLGVDPVMFGYLQTTFAVVQLCGGPLFGRFGDIFGSRAALFLAFGSAAMTYFLLGIANSVGMLFLSRLPSVFMHAMQGRGVHDIHIGIPMWDWRLVSAFVVSSSR